MPRIVGLTRVRNESAIIQDTLDHFAQWCDGGIIVYDDRSTDNTVEIAMKHPAVKYGREDGVIVQFEPWSPDRTREEWRHRQILLEAGRRRKPEWLLYFDADERLEWDGNLPEDKTLDAVWFDLYDAYLVSRDAPPACVNDGRLFGPEFRRIVFAYRNLPQMRYSRPDQRIVEGYRGATLGGCCRHYGKAISVEQWEETCDYYIRWFPEPYKVKWRQRKGKAIHTQSDFGRPLYAWEEAKAHAVCIGELPTWP